MKMHNFYFLVSLFLIIFSCDSFSLREQFILKSQTLNFYLENATLKPQEETQLFIEGGVPPYTVNIILDDVYISSTQATDSGFVSNNEKYTAGLTIGTRILRVRDKSGAVREQKLTVMPKVPINVFADGTYGNSQEVKISWIYESNGVLLGNIESFKIEKLNKSTLLFTELKILPSEDRSCIDGSASPDTINTYRLSVYAKNYSTIYITVFARGDGLAIP